MRTTLLTTVCLLTLVGCGQTNQVAQAENALTIAEQAATVYVRLPLCPQAAGTLCSDATIAAKIKAADNVAYAAVKGAENGTVAPADAVAAVSALSALTPAAK
jgi:hypothetical protein